MNVSKNLLAKFCPEIKNLSNKKLIDCFLNLGYEVENYFDFLSENKELYSGKILKISKLKGYDKLNLLEIDLSFKKVNIVTSYQKLKENDIIVCVLSSGKINNYLIKEQKFNDVTSSGMLCSFDEIGLKDFKSEVIVLSNYLPASKIIIGDNNPLKYLNLDDVIFDLQFPSICNYNKGIYYIALEVATYFDFDFIFFTSRNYFEKEKKLVFEEKLHNSSNFLKYFNFLKIEVDEFKKNDIFLELDLAKSNFKSTDLLSDLAKYTMLIVGITVNIFSKTDIATDIFIEDLIDKTVLEINEKKETYQNLPVIKSNNKIISLCGITKVNSNEINLKKEKTFYFETSLWNDELFCQNFSKVNFSNFEFLLNLKKISPLKLPFALNFFVFLLEQYFTNFSISKKKTINKLTSIAPSTIKINLKKLENFVSFSLNLEKIFNKFQKLGYKIKIQKNNIIVQQPRYRTENFYFNSFAKDIIRFFSFDHVKEKPVKSENRVIFLNETFFKQLNLKKFLINEDFFEDVSYSLVNEKYLKFPSIFSYFLIKNFSSETFKFYRNNVYSSIFYKNLTKIKSLNSFKVFESSFLFSSMKKNENIFSLIVSKDLSLNFNFFKYFQKLIEIILKFSNIELKNLNFVFINKKNNFLNFYWKIYYFNKLIGLFGNFSQTFLASNKIHNKEIWFLEIIFFKDKEKLFNNYLFKNHFPISFFDFTKSMKKNKNTFFWFKNIQEKIITYFESEKIFLVNFEIKDIFLNNDLKNFSFRVNFQPKNNNFTTKKLQEIERKIQVFLNEQ